MLDHDSELTKDQRDRVERFLDLFSEVELALKRRLVKGREDKTPVSALIQDYREKNPFWTRAADELLFLASIRNFLTHNRSAQHGYPVAVTSGTVKALQQIKDHLDNPTPASDSYRKKVDTVSPGDSLASVVAIAFKKGYSQFPVVDSGRFAGLITENLITRWLGKRAHSDAAHIDLTKVLIRSVLKERDPFLKDIPIFRFARLDTVVEEVVGHFASHPVLEVVLLTETGDRKSPIEGIITQWDAARYRS